MSGYVSPFPQRDKLSELMLDIVELIETQFQITYPDTCLAASPQFREDPSLINIIHLILKVTQDYTPCGKYGSTLIVLWLGLIGTVNINSIDLQNLMNNHSVKHQLYARGLTNYSPPKLPLRQAYWEIQYLNLAHKNINFEIKGENRTCLILTTLPTSMVSLHASFTVNNYDCSTLHNFKISLKTISQKINDPERHVLRILIFNANGAENPAFLPVFSQVYQQHNPHLALVTETRLAGAEARQKRLSLDFPMSSILDSIGNYGGLWLLWKSDAFSCQLNSRNNMSLSTEPDIM